MAENAREGRGVKDHDHRFFLNTPRYDVLFYIPAPYLENNRSTRYRLLRGGFQTEAMK